MVRHVLDSGRKAAHINEFRTARYRVFNAAAFFNMDLVYEVKWHRKHLHQLLKHVKKPHTFHKKLGLHRSAEERHRHFQEHVLDSIPFHRNILDRQEKRLETILGLMPKRIYRRLVGISLEYGGTPEYFVYDKQKRGFFFVATHAMEERKKWIRLVQEVYRICDVIILEE